MIAQIRKNGRINPNLFCRIKTKVYFRTLNLRQIARETINWTEYYYRFGGSSKGA
jgi:ribosome recycling factor